MPNKTMNYGLIKPLDTEYYDVNIQNGNMGIIDLEMKKISDTTNKSIEDLRAQIENTNGGAIPLNSTLHDLWIDGETVIIITQPEIDYIAPALTISPKGLAFNGTKLITISLNETGTIYYTLDGTTPTTSSNIYMGVIVITNSTTLKVFAKDTAGNISPIITEVYTLDPTLPLPDYTPPANVTNLNYINATNSSATLTWTASTSSDIDLYNIYRGAVKIGSTKNTTFDVTGLLFNSTTDLIVKSVDKTGNESNGVTIAVVTTKIIFKDSFNRADTMDGLGNSETGQAWSNLFGTGKILNNRATGISTDYVDYVAVQTSYSDVKISMNVYGITAADRTVWIAFRQQDAYNFLMLEVSNNILRLTKWVNSAKTILKTATIPYADGKTAMVKVVGTTIEGYYDGVKYFEHTESQYEKVTKHGIGYWAPDQVVSVDNYVIELP